MKLRALFSRLENLLNWDIRYTTLLKVIFIIKTRVIWLVSEALGMCRDVHIWLHTSYAESWTVGSSFAASFESLGQPRHVASLSHFFFVGISLVDIHLNLLNWFFLIFRGGPLVILIDCMIFLSPFLGVTRKKLLFLHS